MGKRRGDDASGQPWPRLGSPRNTECPFRKGEGAADMPRGGMPGENGDEDGDAGALCAPACIRHCGDAGGRKLPPTTVRQVRHAGPLEGDELASPGDRAVC